MDSLNSLVLGYAAEIKAEYYIAAQMKQVRQ